MAPKKKTKQATETTTQPETKPVPAPSKDTPAVEPPKQVPVKPSVDIPKQTETTTDKKLGDKELEVKPSTLIKLNQSEFQNKILSLDAVDKSEKELRELRAFKFGGKETSISINDAANLLAERSRKFGGNVEMTESERKKRIEKFGGVDNDLEKELQRKRREKFAKKNVVESVFPDLPALTEEERAVIEARKLKFQSTPAEVPELKKEVKLN